MLLLSEAATDGHADTGAGAAADANSDTISERRRGLRVRQHRPVKVFEPLGARYFGGQTEDVSATGLRIELPAYAAVRPGETLSIHVGLSHRGETLANRRQMIPVRVVWVNRDAGGATGRLEAGVEFMANIAARRDAA
jgi:hypothetical protein